ncbi:hypothetical protein CLV51_11168 [Chitinophaga niastensis]|uniref:Uncharacterized protein n=1 Tax=Chitinophaga niastensis TaxID=536980 RepID=A0A2P8H8X7_CHINA|nr:hypothetical protein [Chitinophaga niastensis]PSL42683.1 hypothetical protein CLV51_11168 [Chitinophaga niastensis]
MKESLRIAVRVMLLGGVGLVATQANAQLKVGKNPTTVEKSAILELDADKQGLLLPRLADTVGIQGLTPPDGMIIYLKKAGEEGFYVRNHGYWEKMANTANIAQNYWSTSGNAATAAQFIGTTNNIPFSIRANNIEGIVVDNGYTFLKKLDFLSPGVDVLLIDPVTGKVSSRKLSTGAFVNAMTINADGTATQTLTTADATSYAYTDNGTGDHKLTINTQDGTINAGLLSKADWARFDKATKAMIIGAFDGTGVPEGLSIDNSVVGAPPKLILHAADATHPGAVTTAAQSFDGLKTFLQDINGNKNLNIVGSGTLGTGLTVTAGGATIGGNSTVTGNFHIIGVANNLTVDGNSTVGGTLGVTGATALGNTLGVTGATTLSNTLNVTGATTLSSTLGVTGATTLSSTLNVTGAATLANDLHVKGNTTLDQNLVLTAIAPDATNTQKNVLVRDAVTGNVMTRALSATAFKDLTFAADHAGLDLAIAEDAVTSKVTVSIPIAAPLVTGGLVSNAAQSFAGAKKFGNEVSIQKNVLVGDTTTAANSTFQVAGSVSMSLNVVTGDYTVTPNDYTIIVKNPAVATITLPTAAGIKGRIYTIKKVLSVAGNNIDNKVTIKAAGGEFIEDGNSIDIFNDWTFITVQSDGVGTWYIIKK